MQRKEFEPVLYEQEDLRYMTGLELHEEYRAKVGAKRVELTCVGGTVVDGVFVQSRVGSIIHPTNVSLSIHGFFPDLVYRISGHYELAAPPFDPHEKMTRAEVLIEMIDRAERMRASMLGRSVALSMKEGHDKLLADLETYEKYLRLSYTVHELGGIEGYREDINNAADSLQVP